MGKLSQEVIHADQAKIRSIFDSVKPVFDNLDVSGATKKDYLYRIPYFMDFVRSNGFNSGTYLNYKRSLKGRRDLSVSTKNKYLISAKKSNSFFILNNV